MAGQVGLSRRTAQSAPTLDTPPPRPENPGSMQHHPRTRPLATLLAVLGLVNVLVAQPAAQPQETSAPPPVAAPADLPEIVVSMKGGQRVAGLLVSTDATHLTVRIAGINTRLPIDTIEKYEVLAPIIERYEQLRGSIGDEPEAIVRLARWLQDREQYPLALTEVNRALEIEPDNGEARRLKEILEQLIILRTRPRTADPRKPAPEAANPARPAPGEFPLLTPADINLMRVYEIDLAAKPRVVISRDTTMRLLSAHAGHPLVPVTQEGREAIARRPALEILDLMFKLRAREFYREVQVLDPPASIRLFRENVQRTWLMSCATTQCHGGLEAGRLVLSNHSPNSDPSVYTNLLILERFRTGINADTPAPGEPYGRPLINWDQPERSPLLHVGLPRGDSLFPHPRVPRPDNPASDAWKPEFRSTEDRLFRKAVEWIRAMYRPRPEYPISYAPLRPFEPPTPAPAAATDAAGR